MSAVSKFGTPAATITMSAFFVCAARFRVFEWQTVTVAPAFERRMESGFPTISPYPTIVTSFPMTEIPCSERSRRMPFGVHGKRPSLLQRKHFPTFDSVNPSTSFRASIAATILRLSIWEGRGSCTMSQWICGSAFVWAIAERTASSSVSSLNVRHS